MAKFIGQSGLTYLWSKIKNYVSTQIANLNLDGTYQKKETGKGLSTNDYTTADKNKLSGIAAGAEVNVQANWAETDSSEDSFIKNKPSIPSKTSDLTNDSGFITSADVPEGAAASTTTPLMDGTASVGSETAFARGDHRHPTDTSRQAVISDLETIRSGAAAGANAIPSSQKGVANGVASLDSTGKVPSSQLPSYVDDVVEAYIRSGQTALSSTWLATDSASGTVITPQSGVIYIIMNGNTTYPTNSEFRWGGTAYVPIYDGGATEMTNSEMDTATSNWA